MGGTTSDDDHIVVHHKDRGRAIVDKLIEGGASAPISEWTEAKLEKTIRRNSILREYADELRLARVNALLAAAQENSPIASTYTILLREYADKLRRTRVKDLLADAQEKSLIASTLGQAELTRSSIAPGGDGRNAEGQDSNVAEAGASLGQADLLVLAAEELETRPSNPVGDAALELLADNSFDAILITDPGGTIVYSNNAFTKLTGYEQADVIGKSPKLLQGPGTDMKVLARLRDSMQKGNGDYEGSAINYKKNGTAFIMHWRVVPVRVDGEVKAWVAIQREGVAAE